MDKVSMYAFDEMRTDLLYFWKKLEFFERHVPHGHWCRSVMEMHTKPISGKVPYYLFFFFFSYYLLWVLCRSRKHMDYCSKREMIWSYRMRPIRTSGPPMTTTILPITMKKKKKNLTPHTQPEPGLPGAIYGCKHCRNCGLCTNALGSYLPVICQWLCLSDHSRSFLR